MRKILFVLLLCTLTLARPSWGSVTIFDYDYSEFARIPILDQGRVKPLDTFARTYLEGFYAKDSLRNMKAIEWLAEVLFNPQFAYQRQIFNIPNPTVVDAIQLERRKEHRYSFQELSAALRQNFKTLHPLLMKPREELSLAQKQLLDLYTKVQVFFELSRSLALFFPEFIVPEGELATALGVEPGTALTYMAVRRKQRVLQEVAHTMFEQAEDGTVSVVDGHQANAVFIQKMMETEQYSRSTILRIIPPQWKEETGLWFSPWSINEQGQGSPKSADFLKSWEGLGDVYPKADNEKWKKITEQIHTASLEMAGTTASGTLLSLEVFFNNFKPFVKSLIFYLISFLIMMTGFLFWPKKLRRAAFALLGIGFALHVTGILMRMIIMGRPPVTSLYESIIFVSFIVVLFGIILEWRKKNSIGIIIASCVGIVLHFIGFKYDIDGDTLGMLVAVLDTNFWLSTHVVTITTGYGCCLVAGMIAHIYLLCRILKPSGKERIAELYRNMRGVSMVALFFAVLGTILGGIWADQSWGRFWGWDPKENGALLIVLWLTWLIHGRLAGKLGELGFAVGMVCTTIAVALAWFGVNLLSVGLHSYGFTDNIALNLGLFCGIELLFALGCLTILKSKKFAG